MNSLWLDVLLLGCFTVRSQTLQKRSNSSHPDTQVSAAWRGGRVRCLRKTVSPQNAIHELRTVIILLTAFNHESNFRETFQIVSTSFLYFKNT